MTNIANGRAASKGEITGLLVTTAPESIELVRSMNSDDANLVLFATMTTPDDVTVMSECDGLVSSTGGITCHTAVIAREWEIPGVVGATELTVESDEVLFNGESYPLGTLVTVDGAKGTITFHD